MQTKNSYDVIIIGAGISGLVCGCYLAKAGMRVLIVEQHDKPGGYCTSFKRSGFTFDAAAHSFGSYRESGHVRKVFADLGVDNIVKIRRYDPSDCIITPDFQVTFWNDSKATIAGLAKIFPSEKVNIINFFNFLMSPDQSEFAKLKNQTFDSLLRSFFSDEKLVSLLAFFMLGNGGLTPTLMHAFSGAKIFSEFIIDGGYYPEGGMQNIPNALDFILKKNNGEILYRRQVKKIIIQNNLIGGVELDDNETFSSKYVVAACDMRQTLKNLLGDKITGKQRTDRLNNLLPSLSSFILYLGIKSPFKGLPQRGTNMWYLPNYDLDKIYRQVQNGKLNNAGIFMLRVSPDEKTMIVFMAAPFKTRAYWNENKRKTAQDCLTIINKMIPDITDHITYFDAATPFTLYDYTLNYKGAAYGWAKTPSQTFDSIFSRTSFIAGLYLTGHWTSLAFGIPGTCYSGQDTAKRILRKEKVLV